MTIRDAELGDMQAVTDIYNHAVEYTTAIWNDTKADLAGREQWLRDRQTAGFPVLVAVSEQGEVVGFASYGHWRAFDGFRHTVENSVYVHPSHQGKGIGKLLMAALIERASAQGKHVIVAVIEAQNAGSISLHKAFGFEQTGFMKQVGTKFGRWLDLVFLQLTLDNSSQPE